VAIAHRKEKKDPKNEKGGNPPKKTSRLERVLVTEGVESKKGSNFGRLGGKLSRDRVRIASPVEVKRSLRKTSRSQSNIYRVGEVSSCGINRATEVRVHEKGFHRGRGA